MEEGEVEEEKKRHKKQEDKEGEKSSSNAICSFIPVSCQAPSTVVSLGDAKMNKMGFLSMTNLV